MFLARNASARRWDWAQRRAETSTELVQALDLIEGKIRDRCRRGRRRRQDRDVERVRERHALIVGSRDGDVVGSGCVAGIHRSRELQGLRVGLRERHERIIDRYCWAGLQWNEIRRGHEANYKRAGRSNYCSIDCHLYVSLNLRESEVLDRRLQGVENLSQECVLFRLIALHAVCNAKSLKRKFVGLPLKREHLILVFLDFIKALF